MKVSALLYLGFTGVVAMTLSGCGVSETDAHRFEAAAERVAAIPLDPRSSEGPIGTGADASKPPLRVELVTPHQLWDARDGVLPKGAAKVITLEANDFEMGQAPAVAIDLPKVISSQSGAIEAPVNRDAQRTVQLGAYASQAAAQAAWAKLGPKTQGLTPVFEPVTVNDRSLVRLKVRADIGQAGSLCALVAASDAWCLQAAR